MPSTFTVRRQDIEMDQSFRAGFTKILMSAGSHTETISPVAILTSNKAIYHLLTKQIHLYGTSHAGAMRHRMLLYHSNISLSNTTCGLPLTNVILAVTHGRSTRAHRAKTRAAAAVVHRFFVMNHEKMFHVLLMT